MKTRIPYRFRLVFPILGWAIVCFIFNIAAILNVVSFDPKTQGVFLFISFGYFIISIAIAVFKIIPIPPFSSESAKTLDKNIKKGKLVNDMDNIEIAKTFNILSNSPKIYLRNTFIAGVIYMIMVLVWQLIFSNNYFDFLIISMIEMITISLLIGFALFWPQFQSFEAIRECRNVLLLKDLKPIESHISSISAKFFFIFFYFLDIIMLYILSTLCDPHGCRCRKFKTDLCGRGCRTQSGTLANQ